MSAADTSCAPVLFAGDAQNAYRDPACFYFEGQYHLFFTHSLLENGYMYNFVAHSASEDLVHWTDVRHLTPRDRFRNFCSPGCVLPWQNEYLLCVTSYPLPEPYSVCATGDETARLFSDAHA